MAIGGCQLLAAESVPFVSGQATVSVEVSPFTGPDGLLNLTNGAWVIGTGQSAMDGGNASFVSSGGWRLELNGVSEDGRYGNVTLGLGDPPSWKWSVGGSAGDGCQFDILEGSPEDFSGTIECPSLQARGSQEPVRLHVVFQAKQ